MVDNMDKICIDKIGCRYPYGFYACWMAIFLWISLSIYFDLVNSQFMTLLDLFGFVGFGAIFIFIAGFFSYLPTVIQTASDPSETHEKLKRSQIQKNDLFIYFIII